jgi:hypothetical protein
MASDFDKALVEELAKFADNSMRDGQQSLDKNRVPGVLTVTTMPAYQRFVATVNEVAQENGIEHYQLPGYEFWGGGEVGQPISMLGENPLETLSAISTIGKDVRIKALYRGRQGYGFEPIHDDTQQAALKESFKRGVKDLRIFDMMNEWKNLEKAIRFATEEANNHDGVKILGCVCYTKPTKNGEMAWTPEELADLAVKQAKAGVNIIEIKDYAGNLWSNDEAKEWMGEHWEKVSAANVVSTIRKALNEAGFDGVPLHLHSHGQKPEALDEAIEAGADVVDVGIGLQSGHYLDPETKGEVENTLAFTNIRDILALRMERRGYDRNSEEYTAHPIIERLSNLEHVIEFASQPVLKDRKSQFDVLAKIPEKELRYHAMAGGAIAALWGTINGHWERYGEESAKKEITSITKQETLNELKQQGLVSSHVKTPEDITREDHFLLAIRMTEELWEIGGAFGTVTPGALFTCLQASTKALEVLKGKKMPGRGNSPEEEISLIPDFANIILGRLGKNTGLDKGIGDTALRDRLLDGAEPALFPAKEGSGLDAARESIKSIESTYGIEFDENGVPSIEDATLLAALTKKGASDAIATALLLYIQTGERTNDIEPSRTPYDIAKTTEEMVMIAKVLDVIDEELILKEAQHIALGKQAGHEPKNSEQFFQEYKEVLLAAGFADEVAARGALHLTTEAHAISILGKTSGMLQSNQRIMGTRADAHELSTVVGIEALTIIDILKEVQTGAQDKGSLLKTAREARNQAIAAIQKVGIDAGADKAAILQENLDTGRFNEKQIKKLQTRLDELEQYGDAALARGAKHAEGHGDIEERKSALKQKIETGELDDNDKSDRRTRIEKIKKEIGTPENGPSSTVKYASTAAFDAFMNHAFEVSGEQLQATYQLMARSDIQEQSRSQ